MDKVSVKQRSGQFGLNRVHEIRVGNHAFLVNLVASGAIDLRASVNQDGSLSFPSERAEWTIHLASTGGGKVYETLGGTQPAFGNEASSQRHAGFQQARIIFNEIWGHYFDRKVILPATAEAVAEELRKQKAIPLPPTPEN
jgi:hypothetical protein